MVSIQRDLSEGSVAHPSHVQFGRRVIDLHFQEGIGDVDDLFEECAQYANVLLGREDPPIDSPYLQLAELAAAYHARMREIEALILNAERRGEIKRGDDLYKFRTGSLHSFIELTKRLYDLGSRRLTQEDLLTRQRIDAGEAL